MCLSYYVDLVSLRSNVCVYLFYLWSSSSAPVRLS